MNHKETRWNQDKSIALSRILLLLFAAALAALDGLCLYAVIFKGNLAVQLVKFFTREKVLLFSVCAWICSIPGSWLLLSMNRLLRNLQASRVFASENVRLLRIVSYCCFAAALVCVACAAIGMISLSIIAVAAGFVGLIVRIVKNVFEQAIAMKDELDFTV